MSLSLEARRAALDGLLQQSAPLWQVSTFRQARPDWCTTYPQLTRDLLALDEAALAELAADPAQALRYLSAALPQLETLSSLIDLPLADASLPAGQVKAYREIPGRKVAQIDAFVAAVGKPQAPLVEWCAGKGHLGRRFLMAWGGQALGVERDAELCVAGDLLSRRAALQQRFLAADVLLMETATTLRDAHVVALHACGDLHRRLVESAAAMRAPAIDVAPCCYQRTIAESYLPLSAGSALALDRNALKLAVTETVTASAREAADSARGSAWKLAFVVLREQLLPNLAYQPFRTVPSHWLREDFASFLLRLAEREGLILPAELDLAACEAAGWRRHHESRRLQLVPMAFRRGLEVWLLADLGAWLEKQGYAVTLREFCPRALTPRNVLLSARLL